MFMGKSFVDGAILALTAFIVWLAYTRWLMAQPLRFVKIVFFVNVFFLACIGPGGFFLLGYILNKQMIFNPTDRDAAFYIYYIAALLIVLLTIVRIRKWRSIHEEKK